MARRGLKRLLVAGAVVALAAQALIPLAGCAKKGAPKGPGEMPVASGPKPTGPGTGAGAPASTGGAKGSVQGRGGTGPSAAPRSGGPESPSGGGK